MLVDYLKIEGKTALRLVLLGILIIWSFLSFFSTSYIAGSVDENRIPLGEIVEGVNIQQRVPVRISAIDKAICFDVLFATYRRTNHSDLKLSLFQASYRNSMDVDAALLHDNNMFSVCFPADGLISGDAILEISGIDGKPGDSPTVWLTTNIPYGGVIKNGQKIDKGLIFKAYSKNVFYFDNCRAFSLIVPILGLLIYYLFKSQYIIKILTSGLKYKLLYIPFVMSIALLQVYSIWYFTGDQVDESQLYHFAIGFMGGDFDPHWYGYGSIGMYLIGIVYFGLGILAVAFGVFQSLDAYFMQLFYNGYFVLLARYLFAVIGVITVLIYCNIALTNRVPWVLVSIFACVAIISSDMIHFANYLRTDQLVGFFVAFSILCAIHSKKRIYMYLLAISIAGAISSKISALPLIFFLWIYLFLRLTDGSMHKADFFWVHIVLVASLCVFQPYVNWLHIVSEIIDTGRQGTNFNWGKPIYYNLSGRIIAIFNILVKYCSAPVLYPLFLLVFSKKHIKIIFPCLLMVVLLTIPYLNSNEITYYWFLPVFNLIRFLSLMAVFATYEILCSHFLKMKNDALLYSTNTVGLFLLVVVVSYSILYPGFVDYLKLYKGIETNNDISKKWVKSNLLSSERILIESNVNYVLPIFYDYNDFEKSKSLSNIFLFHRDKNNYLNKIFNRYLSENYLKRIGISQIKGVARITEFDISDLEKIANIKGAYYITSPVIYNRFFNRSFQDLNEEKKNKLILLQSYFRFMISQELFKRFDTGAGPVIEIYRING